MWDLSLFELIASELRRRTATAWLVTYSHSTAVRATLLAAGFQGAEGVTSGEKETTTWAHWGTNRAANRRWLGKEWIERWKRSSSAQPFGWTPEHGSWEDRILSHPQFQE